MSERDLRYVSRYAEIISVIFRHGFGFLITGQFGLPYFFQQNKSIYSNRTDYKLLGVHLREALTELGPTFIKLGQIASTRSDIIPEPVINELEKLQDTVNPVSFHEIKFVVENELKAPLGHFFSKFSETPIASASIGQVHHAVLKNGEPVVVKVQRPYIDTVIDLDLRIFEDLINLFEKKAKELQSLSLRKLLKEFSDSITKELNYQLEAKNCEKMAKNFRKNPNYYFPKVHWNLTTIKILTTEYVDGIKVNQKEKLLEYGCNPKMISHRLSQAIIRQILVHGYFHGDPHPGNILILPNCKIAFLDFGIMGRLTSHTKYCLVILIRAITKKQTKGIIKSISKMGIIPLDVNLNLLTKDLDAFRQEHLEGSWSNVSLAHSISDFFRILQAHRISIPSDFMMVGKTLITLDGIIRSLDPQYDLLEAVKPFSKFLIRNNIRFSKFIHFNR